MHKLRELWFVWPIIQWLFYLSVFTSGFYCIAFWRVHIAMNFGYLFGKLVTLLCFLPITRIFDFAESLTFPGWIIFWILMTLSAFIMLITQFYSLTWPEFKLCAWTGIKTRPLTVLFCIASGISCFIFSDYYLMIILLPILYIPNQVDIF